VERAARRDTPDAPGIGIIIVSCDHGARIQATVSPGSDGAVDVQVTVDLDIPGATKS
jgi:hypothetical protein